MLAAVVGVAVGVAFAVAFGAALAVATLRADVILLSTWTQCFA